MAMVKRVSPGSAFKVGLIVYGLLGLIFGACVSLLAVIGGSALGAMATNGRNPGMFGALFGTLAIVALPIFYGIFGAIFAAIGAVIYNLAAGIVGGLEIELQ